MKTWLAQAAAQGPDTTGLVDFAKGNIVPLILCIIGIMVIAGAKKGKIKDSGETLAIVIIGCLIIGGAVAFMGLGDSLSKLIPS